MQQLAFALRAPFVTFHVRHILELNSPIAKLECRFSALIISYWALAYNGNGNTFLWLLAKMPKMLGKCTEISHGFTTAVLLRIWLAGLFMF